MNQFLCRGPNLIRVEVSSRWLLKLLIRFLRPVWEHTQSHSLATLTTICCTDNLHTGSSALSWCCKDCSHDATFVVKGFYLTLLMFIYHSLHCYAIRQWVALCLYPWIFIKRERIAFMGFLYIFLEYKAYLIGMSCFKLY